MGRREPTMEIKWRFRSSMFPRTYRRVTNLTQALRVLRFVPGEQADSGGLRLGRGAHRLAGMDHLRDGCEQAVGFQLGERGVENGFGTAHRPEELSGHARA